MNRYKVEVENRASEDPIFNNRADAEDFASRTARLGFYCILWELTVTALGEVSRYLCEYAPGEVCS